MHRSTTCNGSNTSLDRYKYTTRQAVYERAHRTETAHGGGDSVTREGSFPPGLAVGESMDRDSLLPPALSESLHMPLWLPWLEEAQFLSAIGPLSAAARKKEKTQQLKVKKKHKSHKPTKRNWVISCFVVFLVSVIFQG